MPTSDYFSASYHEAREKFLATASATGASISTYALPDFRGPEEEVLAVDVASLGPDQPHSVLLLISATHGVEGFCGSACQVGYLADQLAGALPPRTGVLLVHALNPHGFAWLRRVNEQNVDLNRNFRDFEQPLPDSSSYESIHGWLVPEDWDGVGRREADAALQQYIKEYGLATFQAAVSGGQYTRPTGLFYGGTQASWSNRTLRRILQEHLPPSVRRVATIDFHTGLGPEGYGEPIYIGPPDAGFERARAWYGPEVTSTEKGTSTSAVVTGALPQIFGALGSTVEVTCLALEFGTRPMLEVLTALRADHWLHATPDRQSPFRDAIRRQMRDAFYIDKPAWMTGVYGRAADLVLRATRGLACGR